MQKIRSTGTCDVNWKYKMFCRKMEIEYQSVTLAPEEAIEIFYGCLHWFECRVCLGLFFIFFCWNFNNNNIYVRSIYRKNYLTNFDSWIICCICIKKKDLEDQMVAPSSRLMLHWGRMLRGSWIKVCIIKSIHISTGIKQWAWLLFVQLVHFYRLR